MVGHLKQACKEAQERVIVRNMNESSLYKTKELMVKYFPESVFFFPSDVEQVAYKNYAKVLQLLQWQAKENKVAEQMDKRWTLKCPVHLGLLPYLSEGFPKATIVWTHRPASQAIGSLASFVRATQDMHEGGDIELDKLGGDVLNFGREWIKRADDFLETENAKANHHRGHVMFNNLVKDPIATVKQLYKDIDYEFTPEYEERMKAYIKQNNKEREELKIKGNAEGGKGAALHSYKIEDYGLNKSQIEEDLGWYTKKYFKEE